MPTLQEAWKGIQYYLDAGISVMPVRDKPEEYNGKHYEAKTPVIKSWARFQTNIIDPQELFHHMDSANTTAIAIIGGKVSGNLEMIDIDVKEWPEIGALFLTALYQIYPDLYARLRIHQSPSGGYHLLYRISDGEATGNKKIAYHAEHKEAGIESRGEGGYCLAPPSLGYVVLQDVSIPVITMQDRNNIWHIAGSFNQKIKEDKHVKKEYTKDEYYDENPWQHFNASNEAEDVLLQAGWKLDGRRGGKWVSYTRPGKDHGVSATFNTDNRLYYFFTSSVPEVENGRCYTPGTVLSLLSFGGDRKKTFTHLVEKGYGKVKGHIEKKQIHKAALAGRDLPTNFSQEALKAYESETDKLKQRYPFGIFWYEEEDKVKISHERTINVAAGLGFRWHTTYQVCQVFGYVVERTTERTFLDAMKEYISEEDEEYQFKVMDAYERFMQNSRKYIAERLPELLDSEMMLSSKFVSYKFYKNVFLRITSDQCIPMPYSEIDGLIWYNQIRQREYLPEGPDTYVNSCYCDFLDKAVGLNEHLLSCIGYLAHDYKDSEAAYIIVLSEQCPDPKQGGGSGKNIFAAMMAHTTTFCSIAGSQVQYNEKFLQAWNFERIFSIADVPKKFDFSFLKEISSGSATLKKLFKDEISVAISLMPKLIVSTNFSYDVTDGGLKRRIIPLEFTDFFTRSGGVRKYYGKMFPDKENQTTWDAKEWHAYDNIVVAAIQMYLKKGELSNPGLTAGGQHKQFDQSYGQLTREFLEENMPEWLRVGFVFISDFNHRYLTYCEDQNIPKNYRLGAKYMNEAIRVYCEHEGYTYLHNENIRVNPVETKKAKVFTKSVTKTDKSVTDGNSFGNTLFPDYQ